MRRGVGNLLHRERSRNEERLVFCQELRILALPVTLQCLLQSSFSVVDQVMTGQLGSVSIAAIGLGGKFISLFTVLAQAVAAVAGIILAQAVGKRDQAEAGKGFFTNLLLALLLAAGFTAAAAGVPEKIMAFYSEDGETVGEAARYLHIYAFSFLPVTVTNLCSAYLRCIKAASVPLYAGIFSAVLNTGLNYLLIFGNCGFPRMGVEGAALASVAAQTAGCVFVAASAWRRGKKELPLKAGIYRSRRELGTFARILLPMCVCELFWVLGENAYGYVYGHMGTEDCAAMTLLNPVVSLTIGALSGVSQAAGIMTGKLLGEDKKEKAYAYAGKLMKTGLAGSVLLAVPLLLFSSWYGRIFPVSRQVRRTAERLLIVFALVFPVKVQNMILGGGILRSGGKTHYVMLVDLIGTWGFGVPLAFLGAFVWKLPMEGVYFLLSLEEGVRLLISVVLFRRKNWMRRL